MSFDRRTFLNGLAALATPSIIRAQGRTPVGTGESGVAVDIGRRFRSRSIDGAFLLHAVHDDTWLVHDSARADQGFLPASTFKIPNSLIALETAVIRDENEILKWDGVKRDVEAWNQDHCMRTAIAVSAVWFYQELARRIGEKRMREWVERIGYGNRDTSGQIGMFWLTGGLRITPRQQVEFVQRLYADELPFSERSRRIVKDILVLERTDAYVLRGKTGFAAPGGVGVGWFVGWVERGSRAWVFASNVAMKEGVDIALRKSLALEILADLGLIGPTRPGA